MQVYATLFRVSFRGIPLTQYHYPCRQPPLKKGNFQMDSSVQDNPVGGSPFTVSVRLVSSRAVSTSTVISGCFQPGQAKVVLGPNPLALISLVPCAGGLFGGKSNQDEALEMYGRAANLYKMAKKWAKAGHTFTKIAQRHLQVRVCHLSNSYLVLNQYLSLPIQ